MKIDITKSQKVIITVATTGGLHGKEANPNLPEQPEEIVRAMKDAYDAGASIAHIHVRDKNGLTTADLGVYREVVQGVVETCPGMITQIGNGIGVRFENGRQMPGIGFTQEDRMNLLNITPRPDMLTVNAGSFHFQHKHTEVLFDNPKRWNAEFIEGCNAREIQNELECYDISHIENMIKLRDLGVIKGKMHFSLVLGIDGGISASPKNLLALVDAIPEGSSWQVVTIGKHQTPLSMMALAMGANIRVGFEDNVYIDHGVLAKNNAQFVDRAVRMARELGREIATPAEARAMMGMPAEHRRA
jgi:3-keto-5-aminohexanoate cleavage enzyme